MPHRNRIATIILILALIGAALSPAAALTERLRVAWVENGNLMAWQHGDNQPQRLASGDLIRPYLSPDGARIAFTRGEGALAKSLWVVGSDGSGEREIVTARETETGDDSFIAQVGWLDNTTLYFNTLQQTSISLQPRHDLWQANISEGAVEPIFPDGEGGSFSISPNGAYIAIIYPGIYDQENGRIRLLDSASLEWRDALTYPGISTGAEYSFYPEAFWEAEGSALRVAIPDKDLVYEDMDSPPTVLWRLPVDGESEQIGTAEASFFGQPRWSGDGTALTYLQRVGENASNQFALITADGDGQNPVEYASGAAGQIGRPTWLPGTNQFIYGLDEPGRYWIGRPGIPPQHLGDELFNLQFPDGMTYLYGRPTTVGIELHAAQVEAADTTLIARIEAETFVYDAQLNTP